LCHDTTLGRFLASLPSAAAPGGIEQQGVHDMSELMPFHRPSSALTRKVQQQLTQLVAETGLSQARVQSRAEVEAARASAVAQVGQRAMTEIAMLTKLERDLTETVPAAQARLVAIGDLTQIALGSVVMNAARRIGG
jgi:predicted XRE-type DNA-binding protein